MSAAITWQRRESHGRTIFIGTKTEAGKLARFCWYIVDSTAHQGWRYTLKRSAIRASDAAAARLAR